LCCGAVGGGSGCVLQLGQTQVHILLRRVQLMQHLQAEAQPRVDGVAVLADAAQLGASVLSRAIQTVDGMGSAGLEAHHLCTQTIVVCVRKESAQDLPVVRRHGSATTGSRDRSVISQLSKVTETYAHSANVCDRLHMYPSRPCFARKQFVNANCGALQCGVRAHGLSNDHKSTNAPQSGTWHLLSWLHRSRIHAPNFASIQN
jgi:hypothetical protein